MREWEAIAALFETDFGPHPAAAAPPPAARAAAADRVDGMGLEAAADVAIAPSDGDEWRRTSALRIVKYYGGAPDGDEGAAITNLSYGRARYVTVTRSQGASHARSPTPLTPLLSRCYRYNQEYREDAVPFTLDPLLLWDAHTHGAPWRTLLAQETHLAHAQFVASLENLDPEGGHAAEEWLLMYVHALHTRAAVT